MIFLFSMARIVVTVGPLLVVIVGPEMVVYYDNCITFVKGILSIFIKMEYVSLYLYYIPGSQIMFSSNIK